MTPIGPFADKQSARRWAKTLAPATAAESDRVVGAIRRWLQDQPPGGVLLYLAMAGEIRVEDLIGATERPLYTTRTPRRGPLSLHSVHGPRERHPYGFDQPVDSAPVIDPGLVGYVLVPGLAFDRSGGRLGRGKGYYDRLLSTLPGRTFVAVTLERRLIASVPTDARDVPMDWLATEDGVARVG